LDAGQVVDEFHAFLRPILPVGTSEGVHGYSDAFLSVHGEEPQDVLSHFLAWLNTSVLVGHNVSFDVGILKSQTTRLKIPLPVLHTFDTLDIAHRFLNLKQYRLSKVAKHLGLNFQPTHQAQDDTRCTAELLLKMLPTLRRDSRLRRSLVNKNMTVFKPLADLVERWRKQAFRIRPTELLKLVLGDSGLEDYYADKGTRQANLEQLQRVFDVQDDPQLHPWAALQEIIKFTALARNIDFLSNTDNRTPIITIHQAKGLEFDTVFIAGVVEGEIPSYHSTQGQGLEEEKRVFYVAMTRARQRLYLTGHRQNSRGFKTNPSRFMRMLGEVMIVRRFSELSRYSNGSQGMRP